MKPSRKPGAGPVLQRRAIGNLLRLADACSRDAQGLLGDGRRFNVILLIGLAVARMVEAVVASEPGRMFPVPDLGLQSLSDENPVKARLAALASSTRQEPALLADARLPELPDVATLQGYADRAAGILVELAVHFDLELAGGGPAGNARPVRAEVEASAATPPTPSARRSSRRNDPAAARAPTVSARRSEAGQTTHPAPSRSPPAATAATVPLSRPTSGLSSTVFWSLMDHWEVSDLDALALLGHPGGLTGKGTRPRFKMKPDEIDMLIRLRDVDDGLTAAGLDPRKWLHDPVAAAPFRGAAPLAFITQERLPGVRDLLHYLFQQGLRLSLSKQ